MLPAPAYGPVAARPLTRAGISPSGTAQGGPRPARLRGGSPLCDDVPPGVMEGRRRGERPGWDAQPHVEVATLAGESGPKNGSAERGTRSRRPRRPLPLVCKTDLSGQASSSAGVTALPLVSPPLPEPDAPANRCRRQRPPCHAAWSRDSRQALRGRQPGTTSLPRLSPFPRP